MVKKTEKRLFQKSVAELILNKRKNKKRKRPFGIKVRNVLRRKFCPPGTTPLRSGEGRHFICSNYMGPGTDAERRVKQGIKGINSADRAAMTHDLDYNKIGKLSKAGKINKQQIARMTRDADHRMIRTMKKDRLAGKNKTLLDKVSTFVGGTAMRAKMAGENLGLLDPGKYSTA